MVFCHFYQYLKGRHKGKKVDLCIYVQRGKKKNNGELLKVQVSNKQELFKNQFSDGTDNLNK